MMSFQNFVVDLRRSAGADVKIFALDRSSLMIVARGLSLLIAARASRSVDADDEVAQSTFVLR